MALFLSRGTTVIAVACRRATRREAACDKSVDAVGGNAEDVCRLGSAEGQPQLLIRVQAFGFLTLSFTSG